MPAERTGDTPAGATRRKRSVAVSLVLVAGAGVCAIALDRCDRPQAEEDVLVYETLESCLGQGLRTDEECLTAYRAAEADYPASAPRYASAQECRAHHGQDGCVTGETIAPDAAGVFVPLMAGFMIGRTAGQDVPIQPLYRHAPEPEAGGTAGTAGFVGGYCTGAGGRVPAGHGTAARVPSDVARTTTSSPRMVARGGFGGTGRAVAFSGGGSGGVGG